MACSWIFENKTMDCSPYWLTPKTQKAVKQRVSLRWMTTHSHWRRWIHFYRKQFETMENNSETHESGQNCSHALPVESSRVLCSSLRNTDIWQWQDTQTMHKTKTSWSPHGRPRALRPWSLFLALNNFRGSHEEWHIIQIDFAKADADFRSHVMWSRPRSCGGE